MIVIQILYTKVIFKDTIKETKRTQYIGKGETYADALDLVDSNVEAFVRAHTCDNPTNFMQFEEHFKDQHNVWRHTLYVTFKDGIQKIVTMDYHILDEDIDTGFLD